jgi:RNA polymerase sigma-70 factor (ECF subfamily)
MSGAGSVTVSDVVIGLGPAEEEQSEAAPAEEAPAKETNVPLSAAEDRRLRAMMTAHFNFIWRSLQRLGVPQADVDDCVQQVFLVASRRLSIIAEGSEQAFLFGTALNVAAEARRNNARRRDVPATDEVEAYDPAPPPDELADRTRKRALLDKVLEAMPMDLRAAFVLYELEEMPIHTIASFLNIPVGTAASRLRRARTEFQRLVTRLNATGALRGVKR